MNTRRNTIWVELITRRDHWGYARAEIGKVLKREPKDQRGFFVKVVLEVPREVQVEGKAEIC